MILKSFDWFNEFVKSIKSSCSSGDKYSKTQLYKSKHIRQQFGQIGSDLTDYKNTSFKIEIHADVMLCTLTMAQERNKKNSFICMYMLSLTSIISFIVG